MLFCGKLEGLLLQGSWSDTFNQHQTHKGKEETNIPYPFYCFPLSQQLIFLEALVY